MADYAPNYTDRYRLTYRCGGRVHTQTWRLPAGSLTSSLSGLIAQIGAYYSALAPRLFADLAFLKAEASQANSNYFLPAALPVQPAVGPIPAQFPVDGIKYYSFIGRTSLGNRWVLFQYGAVKDENNTIDTTSHDFRINPGEDTNITAAINVLQAMTQMVGNDDQNVLIYGYANFGINAHLQRKVRVGK